LEQGRLQGFRPGPRQAAGDLGRAHRLRGENDEARYWLFQALAIEAGAELANANGTKVNFNDPACVEALQYWIDLSAKYHAHPPGIVDWGITPRDFLEAKVAMIWTTTGNLSNIRANAKFPFGVAMLPAQKRRGSPTGGGNFHLFKGATPAQQAASLRFLKWITSPERAAQWGIDTGYVAARPDAWDTEVMKKYVAGFPAAAVARDQSQYAVAELSTHDNQRVTQALDDELQAALNGSKSATAALDTAQSTATRLLRPYAH
jgi:sn-glycerol 3-phosphate transport system substrate-binding protein